MKTTRILAVMVLLFGVLVETTRADFTFGEPTNLGPTVNSSANDYDPSMSADELELYFISERSGGYGGRDIWVATRASSSDPWAAPGNLGPTVNTADNECCPDISVDGLSLFFWSNRPGGSGGEDLWVTTRATLSDPWDIPVNLGHTVNSSAWDGGPSISVDGLSLFFFSTRSGGYGNYDLWVTTRTTVSAPWGEPANLGPTVNSPAGDATPDISADRLALFFFSTRSGGYGNYDLWVTTRTTHSNPFSPPVNLGPTVNSSGYDFSPNILANGSTLLFTSDQPGGLGGEDIWQVSIGPVLDLNGDEVVDAADMCIIVDNWGTDNALCDIGPMPWGDGVVDVHDLVILAEHFFEEILPPDLTAYWKLDEVEGDFAHEGVGGGDDVVMGSPLWQPMSGQVDGALELDGVDDYVICSFKLDPTDGPFSVFAWIKGGAAGQVIVSQFGGGANCLMVDAEGKLMTEFGGGGRGGGPLLSEAVIRDGQWHRIGLVWDSSQRKLCADGVVVAEDPPSAGASGNGLYIGAGKHLASNSFFSGLIDDVRIYNVALSAERIEALAQ